jgi:hypothetical protein
MKKRKRRSFGDMGDVIEITDVGFKTSNGLVFDFPFPMPDVSVEVLNKLWHSWSRKVDNMMAGTLDDFLNGELHDEG